mgnify:CR=1 FL=1
MVFVLDGVLIGAGDGRYLALAGLLALLAYVPLALMVNAQQGGLVWLRMEAEPEAQLVRGLVATLGGGHATLVRASPSLRAAVPDLDQGHAEGLVDRRWGELAIS